MYRESKYRLIAESIQGGKDIHQVLGLSVNKSLSLHIEMVQRGNKFLGGRHKRVPDFSIFALICNCRSD